MINLKCNKDSDSFILSFLYFLIIHLQVQLKNVETVKMDDTMHLLNYSCQITEDNYNTMFT